MFELFCHKQMSITSDCDYNRMVLENDRVIIECLCAGLSAFRSLLALHKSMGTSPTRETFQEIIELTALLRQYTEKYAKK